MSYNLIGAQAMQGTRGRPEDLMNANAPCEANTPSLSTKLASAMRRVDGVIEALDMLRSKLEPVLQQETRAIGKDSLDRPAEPGSVAMQTVDEIIGRLDAAHMQVNDLLRRAAI